MRMFWWGLFGATAGLILGYLATVAIGVVAMELFQVSQREGAAAMGLVFIIGPLGGLVSAVIGTAWALIATRRRMRRREAGTLGAPQPFSPTTRIALGIVIGLLAGYAAAWLLMEIFYAARGDRFFATYAAALTAAWTPIVMALGGGGLGGWLGAGFAHRPKSSM
ncbi:MAG: hypothetical protein J0H01_15615 [Rhizobiales bacterium]|nr:hypothetical protein [Hyphomicrobiales bacterium]